MHASYRLNCSVQYIIHKLKYKYYSYGKIISSATLALLSLNNQLHLGLNAIEASSVISTAMTLIIELLRDVTTNNGEFHYF